ncbi:glycogen synthase GlgA [Acidisphaera sp. L21]|uniref:glycogen synthase GlgA n=1 Tax=Acidisphaera sp. L21 TaxID=1641851 RepID=UPI00131DCE23|nr:glycogen synthase GlgA [Acidisphaera sp. L21]
MKVLATASEIFPLVKTGGLADVMGALPRVLAKQGLEVRTLVPGYPAILAALTDAEPVYALPTLHGGSARVLAGKAAGLDLFVLDAPHLFDRPGNPYMGPDGRDWPDNPQRFAALSRVAADIGLGAVPGWIPGAVNCHDWQTGLAPAYLALAGGARPRTVMTIHNLAFTGQVPMALWRDLGLPPDSLGTDGVEFYNAIGYMKAGLYYADAITTVSPTYAAEIQTPEFGCGFDGLLRTRHAVLHGILNGLDETVWDPWSDPALPARFRKGHLRGKTKCKAALQTRLGLATDAAAPLFGIVSRLTGQKGMDLVLDTLPTLLEGGAQLAVLGSGDRGFEDAFRTAAAAHPGQVATTIGYDEALSHQLVAGVNALLVPSRFEPCGLTQMMAMRYGALPVVSRVGGLADSIVDANEAALRAGVANGIVADPTQAGLTRALQRALGLWQDQPAWTQAQRVGMAAELGWEASAKRYAEVLAH